jgi:hypothetical protein
MNPTTCRIVLYHFTVTNREGEPERRVRPAIVTSVSASDDVVNLFVFFEPDDLRNPYSPPAQNQMNVHPFDPTSQRAPGWSWPPRS